MSFCGKKSEITFEMILWGLAIKAILCFADGLKVLLRYNTRAYFGKQNAISRREGMETLT